MSSKKIFKTEKEFEELCYDDQEFKNEGCPSQWSAAQSHPNDKIKRALDILTGLGNWDIVNMPPNLVNEIVKAIKILEEK
jgi:hypothetical protein